MRRVLTIAAIIALGAFAWTQVAPVSASSTTDIAYGTDPLQKLDVYPATTPNAPAVVLIHGGGWYTGDKASLNTAKFVTPLHDAGFVVVVPNYRLAPADPYPAAYQDVKAAVAWTRTNAAAYGIDATHVVAYGGSAGGTLSMMLAAHGDVDAAVSLAGPVDFAYFLGYWPPGAPTTPGGALRAFLGNTAPASASPFTYASHSSPVFFTDGEYVTATEATNFDTALGAVDHHTVILPTLAISQYVTVLTGQAIAWLQAETEPSPTTTTAPCGIRG